MPSDDAAGELPSYEPREVGDGLILRSATTADAEPLAALNALVHGGSPETLDEQAAIWTRDLLRGDHPTSFVSDFTVVEESGSRRPVSSCLLISQTWTYAGIPFGVGRPEVVSTHPDYRGRGLIRAQFDLVHARSAARGHLMQALTGIPHFYRQFGYEPALVNPPPRFGFSAAIEALPDREDEPYRFRPVTTDDLPFVVEMYRRSAERGLLAAVRDEAIWRYELTGRDPGSDYCHDLFAIETRDSAPIGLICLLKRLVHASLFSSLVEMRNDHEWYRVAEPVLRFAKARGEELANLHGETFRNVGFDLTPDHPFPRLTGSRLPISGDPFPWQVRLADMPAFLRLIAPVLESRLGASPATGYTGDLRLSFFGSGVRIAFADGRLASVESWRPDSNGTADAAFPDQSFWYLLLGSRALNQLEPALPDLRIRSDLARVLIEALFPVAPSVVWPVG